MSAVTDSTTPLLPASEPPAHSPSCCLGSLWKHHFERVEKLPSNTASVAAQTAIYLAKFAIALTPLLFINEISQEAAICGIVITPFVVAGSVEAISRIYGRCCCNSLDENESEEGKKLKMQEKTEEVVAGAMTVIFFLNVAAVARKALTVALEKSEKKIF